MASVRGRPDSGLVGSGLDEWRAAAGRRGEISIRKALMAAGILDDPDVRAWFSCHNPSDPSRERGHRRHPPQRPHRLAAGRETVFAQERERVDPARPASGRPGPFRLEGTMDTPFHASANMRLAVDAIRRLCPTAGIRAVNLLARTRKGTYRGRRNGRAVSRYATRIAARLDPPVRA